MGILYPYAGWSSPEHHLDAWAVLGFGGGRVSIAEEAAEVASSAAVLRAAAMGATGHLLSDDRVLPGGTTSVDGRLSYALAHFGVAGSELMSPLQVDTQRLRLILRAEHERLLGHGGQIAPALEVGLRRDTGDGEEGIGLEVGAGLRYLHPAWGLTAAGQGRLLVTSEASYDEWGADLTVQFDPGLKQQGMSVDLTTGYGQPASGLQQLWAHEPSAGGAPPVWTPEARLTAEMGYGVALAETAMVTPYAGVALSGGGARQYRIGSRMSLDQLQVSIEGERRDRAAGSAALAADYSISLQGSIRY